MPSEDNYGAETQGIATPSPSLKTSIKLNVDMKIDLKPVVTGGHIEKWLSLLAVLKGFTCKAKAGMGKSDRGLYLKTQQAKEMDCKGSKQGEESQERTQGAGQTEDHMEAATLELELKTVRHYIHH